MAACLKCGKAKLRRDDHGRRKCRRCGCMPSGRKLDQGGNPPPIINQGKPENVFVSD